MIDRVGKDTFKLHRNVDLRLSAIRSDLAHPLVSRHLDVLFHDFAHNLELTLEEHWGGSLSVKLPFFISWHEREMRVGQRLKVGCICPALGNEFALCDEDILDHFRVAQESEDLTNHDLGYRGEP